MIDELEVNLKNKDVGGTLGTHGREIIFNTHSGDVWLKKTQGDSVDLVEQQALKKQVQMQLTG